MNLLVYALWTAHLLSGRQAPVGTALHVRLTAAVGSYASTAGSPIHAVLISPVVINGQIVLPMGAMLDGEVASVNRVGIGIMHETASLGLNFNEMRLSGGERIPISARVQEVDNARERVDRLGLVHGVRATGSLCYRASGYIQTALEWEIHAELAEWFFRALIIQLPEPEIYYPPGVEMTLKLVEPLVMNDPETVPATAALSEIDRMDLEPVVEQLPLRAQSLSGRPADLVNVLFIGSREQIQHAFTAAGWTTAEPVSLRARIRGIRAVAERAGYRGAPMSSLLLNNAGPDMSWQKGLNDMSKRHHIRIWKQPETWQGQALWVGAATRDLNFAFFRPGQMLTHKVEKNVDEERDKVSDDLIFASCVDAVDSMERDQAPRSTRNSTGDLMNTDARLAVVRLKDCAGSATPAVTGATLPMHGGKWQRFLRREILSMRSDLLRTNIYYRIYEGGRLGVEAVVRQYRNRVQVRAAMLAKHQESSGTREDQNSTIEQ